MKLWKLLPAHSYAIIARQANQSPPFQQRLLDPFPEGALDLQDLYYGHTTTSLKRI